MEAEQRVERSGAEWSRVEWTEVQKRTYGEAMAEVVAKAMLRCENPEKEPWFQEFAKRVKFRTTP